MGSNWLEVARGILSFTNALRMPLILMPLHTLAPGPQPAPPKMVGFNVKFNSSGSYDHFFGIQFCLQKHLETLVSTFLNWNDGSAGISLLFWWLNPIKHDSKPNEKH